MIIASDLDRTLFYSSRALKELGSECKEALKPVEEKDRQCTGFMTEKAYLSLLELCRHCLFIPVTTRTTEQYRRFFIFQRIFRPAYAITLNGAMIHFDGRPLTEWSSFLSNKVKTEAASRWELLNCLAREGFQLDGQQKQADDWFFYFILNSIPNEIEREELETLASKLGWRTSLQGRKLYIVPKAINKGAALSFICERVGKEPVAGAGDSLLDWDFLKLCKHRFVPRHGELAGVSNLSGLTVTKNAGVAAGWEILQELLALAV